ncbi:MAG: hypothetical protein Q4D57_06130 [Clostridia bacterium]|nr:hypothetical protein [Clostridia bacterium]
MINHFLGKTVMTSGVNNKIAESEKFAREIKICMEKYITCDWGDLCNEDKEMNDNALRNGNDRILAAYDTSEGKVYIITEHDRSATTILFADEY